MNKKVLLALMSREMRERKQLLLASALLGVLALLSAWLPQAREVEPNEVRATVALLMSGVLVVCAALALGYSMFSRDLAEGRLAFYYVQPIPAWTLWCGKFLAVALLLAATVCLVWLPTLLAGGSMAIGNELLDWPKEVEISNLPTTWAPRGLFVGPEMWLLSSTPETLNLSPPWFLAIVGLLFLLLLTHLAAIIFRSASPRILIDIAALVIILGLASSAFFRLAENGAYGTLTRSFLILVVATFAAFFFGGLLQTSIGRTSPARSHMALSAGVWGSLLLVFGTFEVVSRQVIQADLGDLAQVANIVTAPRGEWMVVGGPAQGQTGYAPVFAYRPITGERRKIDQLPAIPNSPMFAPNGQVLAWESCPFRHHKQDWCEVRFLDLSKTGAKPISTGIRTTWRSRTLFFPILSLDETGRRLAVVDQGRLSIYEISSVTAPSSSGVPLDYSVKTLAAVELAPTASSESVVTPRFLGPRLHVFFANFRTQETLVSEFDLNSRQLTERTSLPGFYSEHSTQGDLVAFWGHRDEARVFRTADLSLVANLVSGKAGKVDDVRFLADSGWILTEWSRSEPSRLRRFDSSGNELWSLEIPHSLLFLGLEESPGRLWLGVWQWDEDGKDKDDWTYLENRRIPSWAQENSFLESRLLDLETGHVLLKKSGYLPNGHAAPAGSPATRILLGQRGAPVSVEMLAGQKGQEAKASQRILLEIFAKESGDS